jgi:membrane-bound lytic murein transglycosylase A
MKANYFFAFVALLLSGCAALEKTPTTTAPLSATYTPVSYQVLQGWNNDPLTNAQSALIASCKKLLTRDPQSTVAPTEIAGRVSDWTPACQAIINAPTGDFRKALQDNFTPHRVQATGQGLFTGYYEKQLRGSLTKTARYNTPLYKRPPELVMVDLGLFRPNLKGERIAGQVVDGHLKPFADRAQIDNGALAGRGLELAWVDDADAAFFLHIQGSGQVMLENGTVLRVGYDGQNGHVYTAIGKELIARGELTPETTSLQTIRAWLKAHPSEAAALRQKNPSYIFFRVLTEGGPVGAQGVTLTPTRSMAVDPRFVPYTAPVWINAAHPKGDTNIQRLMIAQDTGGAIRGAVRGDFFWGAGEMAEEMAGIMKSKGDMWVLLPKAISGQKTVTLPQ